MNLYRQLPEVLQAKFSDVDVRPWLGRRIMNEVAVESRGLCNGGLSERISKVCLDFYTEKSGAKPGEHVKELENGEWIKRKNKLYDEIEIVPQSVKCLTERRPLPFIEMERNGRRAAQIDFFESVDDKFRLSYAYNTPVVLTGSADTNVIPEVSARAYAFMNIKGDRALRAPAVCHVDAIGLIHDEILGSNYTHWLLDWFPRLHLLKIAGADIARLTYIMPCELTRFQRETFAAVGVSEPQIIVAPYLRDGPLISIGTRKVVGCNTSGPAFRHALHHGQSWAYDFIRSSLVKVLPKPHRKIILNRRENRRAVFDEGAALLLRREGFDEVFTDGMSLSEQIEIFASSTHVIGIHGAGMANLAFCNPGTHVLEIFPESLATLAFWFVSKAGGLNYVCCVGEQIDGDKKLIEYSRDVLVLESVIRSWLDEVSA